MLSSCLVASSSILYIILQLEEKSPTPACRLPVALVGSTYVSSAGLAEARSSHPRSASEELQWPLVRDNSHRPKPQICVEFAPFDTVQVRGSRAIKMKHRKEAKVGIIGFSGGTAFVFSVHSGI